MPYLGAVTADLLVVEQCDRAHRSLMGQSAFATAGVDEGLRVCGGGVCVCECG